MHLQSPFVCQNDFGNFIPDYGCFVIFCIIGINPDTDHNNTGLGIDLFLNLSG